MTQGRREEVDFGWLGLDVAVDLWIEDRTDDCPGCCDIERVSFAHQGRFLPDEAIERLWRQNERELLEKAKERL